MAIGLLIVLCSVLVARNWWLVSAGGRHDHALALWKSKEPKAYSFEFSYCSGMCEACTVRVTVQGGQVVNAVGTDPAGCSIRPDEVPTIEGVFKIEKDSRSSESTDSFTIRYDPTWGFPASGEFQCPEGWMDCGSGFRVTHFRVER